MHGITMLGTGLIGGFYTRSLHGHRRPDRVRCVWSRRADRARAFAASFGIPRATDDLEAAVRDPETDVVVVGLPNHLHLEAVRLAAAAGKAVLCTKPLGRNAAEALRMLEAVEAAGVFHGYLEDLVFPPKTLKALAAVRRGALGRVLWVRSRETHAGPHSDWFWDPTLAGGGALIDMGCHCVEIGRAFLGKGLRPEAAFCWAATQLHPIEVEDHAIGLVRYEGGVVGQLEVGWTFRGGMDLRDEVGGTEGTIWLNHFLRTGLEMFTAAGGAGYVAEKAESERGWLFPVGDEGAEMGYDHMFTEMLDALDGGREPVETFRDGYTVNEIIDACYRSARSGRWEEVRLERWAGGGEPGGPAGSAEAGEEPGGLRLLKEELMPDGRVKRLLRDPRTGRVEERWVEEPGSAAPPPASPFPSR